MSTVNHYILGLHDSLHSTYASTLKVDIFDLADPAVEDHPGSLSARPEDPHLSLHVALFHGRDKPDEDMDDWGFNGPEFSCASIAHDPDRLLLQHCDPVSVAMATRLGLEVHDDTITIEYDLDGVLRVPRFRDEKPAFFGDFAVKCVQLR